MQFVVRLSALPPPPLGMAEPTRDNPRTAVRSYLSSAKRKRCASPFRNPQAEGAPPLSTPQARTRFSQNPTRFSYSAAPALDQSSRIWVNSNHWTSARRIISGRVGKSGSARRRSSIISISSRGSRSVRASVSFFGGAINNTILMLTS